MIEKNRWAVAARVAVGKRSAESGQGLLEYALILALVAVSALAALTMFGVQLSGIYGRISERLPF